MRKIRWGVLGVAKIAIEKVIPAMQRGSNCIVAAIASRDLQKARVAAAHLDLPQAYGCYEDLLADPTIEAIYNPLPNHLHLPWSLKTLEAGKHLLCEKPIGLSAAEGAELVAAAHRYPQLKVMEAFMYRHHPQWQMARRLINEGRIGPLRAIQCLFSYFNRDPANVRNKADIGGGGLLDIGCYPVSVSRFLFGREPARVCGQLELDPDFGTDRLASAILDFQEGTSVFTCSTQLFPYQRVHLFGTEGRIEIEIPFNAPPDRPCRLWHMTRDTSAEIQVAACDQYQVQGELMSEAILNDTPVPTPIEDAVANMRVLEGIKHSSQTGTWVSLS